MVLSFSFNEFCPVNLNYFFLSHSELVKEKSLLTQLKEVIFLLDCKAGGLLKLAYNAAFYTGAEEEAMTLVVSAFEENQFESIYNILVAVNGAVC